MTGIDRQPDTDPFLASKRATWDSFIKLSVGASAAIVVILAALALIFVV